MQSKRKKFWIIFSTVLTSVLVIIIVLSLVFRLKTVDVELRYRLGQGQSQLPEQVQEKVLSSGEFNIGKNMFFYNTDENVKKIEKNIPFVKVEQVIKYFPNVIRVYISERIMKYRVYDSENANIMYILDEDFKVLKTLYLNDFISDEFENSKYYKSTVLIDKNILKIKDASEGDFITGSSAEYVQSIMNAAMSGIYGRTKDIGKALSATISENNKGELLVEVTMKFKNIKIVAVKNNKIEQKIWTGVSLIYSENMIENDELLENETIFIEEDSNGEIVARRPSQNANN